MSHLRLTLGALSVLTSLLLAGPVYAAGPPPDDTGSWPASFDAKSVSGLDVFKGQRVLIAGAGDGSGEPADALRALARGPGSATSVLDGSPLGDISSLGDQEVLAKAGALPIDLVTIVRVFPAGDGGELAVVVVYRLDGTSIAGGSAEKGSALEIAAQAGTTAAAPPEPNASEGTGDAARESVESALHVEERASKKSRRRWNKEKILLEDWRIFSTSGGMIARTKFFSQGDQRDRLGWEKFYGLVGHPEHAKWYKKRRRLQKGLFYGGVGLLTVGPLAAMPLILGAGRPKTFGANFETQDVSGIKDARVVGYIAITTTAVVGGIAMMTVGVRLKRQPVTQDEALDLAEAYNRELAAELGIPLEDDYDDEDEAAEAAISAAKMRWRPQSDYGMSLHPQFNAGGGGAALRLQF